MGNREIPGVFTPIEGCGGELSRSLLCRRPSRAGFFRRRRFRADLAPEAEGLRQLGTLRRIVRRDDRMIALEVEGGAIFGKRQMMCRRDVTLERFELLGLNRGRRRFEGLIAPIRFRTRWLLEILAREFACGIFNARTLGQKQDIAISWGLNGSRWRLVTTRRPTRCDRLW